jgi:hypothetical protein
VALSLVYQVGDEEVGGVLHGLVPDDDEHDKEVAQDADDEDEAVQRRQQDLESQVVDHNLEPEDTRLNPIAVFENLPFLINVK